MEKLPSEILQDIFTFLTLGERITCLGVCRAWCNVLDKHCLFYNIIFRYNVDRFTTFMNLMEKSRRHAAQVTELEINSCLPSNFNKRKLCEVFPNVKKLIIKSSVFGQRQPAEHFKKPLAKTHSNSKVQVITDEGHCELASQMLSSNLCGRLKELNLNVFNPDIGGALFRQLKNLANLEELSFSHLKMGIDDLEDMHNNLPVLQYLRIQRITLLNSSMPDNIAPLSSIQTFGFRVSHVANIDTHIALYRYMTKKYINAKGGTCKDECLDKYTPGDSKRMYDSAVFDYLRLFAPKSSEFTALHIPNGINIFEVLDGADCQFETFNTHSCESHTLIQDLAQSKQSQYIKVLEITNTPMHSPELLQNMAVLTDFSLFCYRERDYLQEVDLSDILNGLPKTVTKFTLGCPIPKGVPFNTTFSSIEMLDITCDELTKEVGEIVSTCFPKLVELKFHGSVTENINIALNNDSLESVVFEYMHGMFGFSFKSASQTDIQHYLWNKDKLHDAIYDDIKRLPNLSFNSYKKKRLDRSNGIEIFSIKE